MDETIFAQIEKAQGSCWKQWDVTGIYAHGRNLDVMDETLFPRIKNTCELLEVLSTWMSNRFMPTCVEGRADPHCQGHMNTYTPNTKKKEKKSTTVTLLLWVCIWL